MKYVIKCNETQELRLVLAGRNYQPAAGWVIVSTCSYTSKEIRSWV